MKYNYKIRQITKIDRVTVKDRGKNRDIYARSFQRMHSIGNRCAWKYTGVQQAVIG